MMAMFGDSCLKVRKLKRLPSFVFIIGSNHDKPLAKSRCIDPDIAW